MKQKIKTSIKNTGVILGISFSVFLLTFVVLAWTGPQHTPPTCTTGEVGCDEVLHTGTSAQSKSGGLLLNTGGATNGLIVENGNVGIGTTTPGYKLDVVGDIFNTSGSVGAIGLSSHLPGYAINTYPTLKTNAANLYFSAGGAYSAYMNSAGTWTARSDRNIKENFIELDPQEILTKIDQLPMYQWNFKTEDSSIKHIAPVAQDFFAFFGLNGDNDKTISNIDPPGVALVGIKALSNKFSILESGVVVNENTGNVGIGTTSPSYKLHVNGTAYASGAAGALSDIRHKKEVTDLSFSGIDIIERLRPVSFLWKEPEDSGMEGTQMGFIAQEVEEVLPEAVLTMDNEEETKGLKYNSFIPVLVKAVKEQQEEIESLKKRIIDLETK
jgi:hypothetical protein